MDSKVPVYYYYGARKQQIVHCRLRLGVSDLNYDLYRRHLLDDPACRCGHPAETSEHFLLFCPIFNDARAQTIHILDAKYKEVTSLLFGQDNLQTQENIEIFSTVHAFLVSCDRLWEHPTTSLCELSLHCKQSYVITNVLMLVM